MQVQNISDFDAGRATGILATLTELELIIEEMAPSGDSQTAIGVAAILNEVLQKAKDRAKKNLDSIIG